MREIVTRRLPNGQPLEIVRLPDLPQAAPSAAAKVDMPPRPPALFGRGATAPRVADAVGVPRMPPVFGRPPTSPEHKAALVARIAAHECSAFTREELQAMPTDQLQKLDEALEPRAAEAVGVPDPLPCFGRPPRDTKWKP